MSRLIDSERIRQLSNKYRERLLLVVRIISEVPDEEFNMEHWWLEDGSYFDQDRNILIQVSKGRCGCAFGHVVKSKRFDELTEDLLEKEREDVYSIIGRFFGVQNKLASFIFNQYHYLGGNKITKYDVINRINFVIQENFNA